MFALLVIILIAGASLHFTDLESDASFYSVFLPLVDVFSLIALTLWLVLYFHSKNINQHTDTGGGSLGGFFGGSDGGDGGG